MGYPLVVKESVIAAAKLCSGESIDQRITLDSTLIDASNVADYIGKPPPSSGSPLHGRYGGTNPGPTPVPLTKEKYMKFSYNTWGYASFFVWVPAYTLEETIKRHRDSAMTASRSVPPPARLSAHLAPSAAREINELLQDHGLELSSMLPAPSGGPGNNPARRIWRSAGATIEHYKELAELSPTGVGRPLLYIPGWVVFGTTAPGLAMEPEALTEVADATPLTA